MNRLAREKSAYLRYSAEQKIDWYPWCQDAFEEAQKQDKPIFVSSGAIWCHWCHVMAKESFYDEEIVEILNRDFICIKLDRDERPDIDRRLQMAVQLMTGTGGWPLSVFMTPEGKPFFGGTYFPPDDRYGRAGFRRILRTVADFYRNNKGKILEYSDSLVNSLSQSEKVKSIFKKLDHTIITRALEVMLSSFDIKNGGFGTAPKFPMPGALGFLINLSFFERKNELLKGLVTSTLLAMAKGGIHDHIGGGFHRYSTDEAWIIPHFEKMTDDNAMLLRNYIDAYYLFRNETFRDVALGIIKFVREVLSDPEGGFYASQDADVTPDDEGGYFTWKEEEVREVLDDDEYRIIKLHLFDEKGSMHHDPSKKVLFVAMDINEVASRLNLNEDYVKAKLMAGKEKILALRRKRTPPFIDTNLYTSLNGMMISSFVRAYRVLKDENLKDFAIKSLGRILLLRYDEKELFHSEGVEAMLDDYVYLIEALIAVYEVTGEAPYIDMAERLLSECINKFYDSTHGGFYDTAQDVLGLRLKTIEDIPHPSANSIALTSLIKLFQITDKKEYLDMAYNTIMSFLPEVEASPGIHFGSFYDAINMYFQMLRLSVHAKIDSELTMTAISELRPYTTIKYSGGFKSVNGVLERDYVLPCSLKECLDPLYQSEDLKKFLSPL